MADAKARIHGTQLPPDRGHPMPRRTTSEMSVTLRHHRQAREAGMKSSTAAGRDAGPTSSPRRNSSGESHETGHSDPKRWFDQSNHNPGATFDANSMDVDPPFFQKETDSSNEELREIDLPAGLPGYPYVQGARQVSHTRPAVTHSSSADDYRSVIDDLTIENKRLKEELKRYRQFGTDILRKEKLFEIKVHGLPKRKKRELEATLRDFAATLEGSTESSPQRKKPSRHAKNVYSSMESMSKHPSSSSSHSRPVDSAYASMSTGPSSAAAHSSGTSFNRPSMLSRARSSEQNVETYLEDIPEGLYPRHRVLTDKEKKKLVVRRLEQLFTGKITGKNLHRNQSMPSMEAPGQADPSSMAPPRNPEPSREAKIQALDVSQKNARSRDNLSTSNSGGDQTESGGNGNGSGSGSGHGSGTTGNNRSPPGGPPPEQRPTRPRDLDPDRVQIPAENMDYIRHLGLVAPELLAGRRAGYADVSPDAEGWVYLNLLCSMAQLHMINVTPNFIRLAVAEKSTKFQLSPDGRKIRWRGGTDGTKFSSDSSGDNSRKSPTTDDTDGSNDAGQRKKGKSQAPGTTSAPSSKNPSKFGPQASGSLDSFHYKPLFVHPSSSIETSPEDTGSPASYGQMDESNQGNTPRWNFSGSGSSQRKKRRHDGAIIYYSGAPFCTDLSGDPGDISPTTYLTYSRQEPGSEKSGMLRQALNRSMSGSSLSDIRPLSDGLAVVNEAAGMDVDEAPELIADDGSWSSDVDLEFPWCAEPPAVSLQPLKSSLEPCGLGGVLPDDHFAVIVTTRRPILPTGGPKNGPSGVSLTRSEDAADSVVGRLATMSTPWPSAASLGPAGTMRRSVQIEYLSGRIRRLRPVPLPPPATFFPPFSSDSESSGDDALVESRDDEEDEDLQSSEGLISQRANPHLSDNTYPDGQELSSNDEEGEVDGNVGYESPAASQPQNPKRRASEASKTAGGSAGVGAKSREQLLRTGSSVATAGGAESGYSSGVEDDGD